MICNKCGKNNPLNVERCPSCGEEMPGSVNCGGFADILTYTPEPPREEVSAGFTPVVSAPGMSEAEAVSLADKIKLSILISLATAGICLISFICVFFSNSNLKEAKEIAKNIEVTEEKAEKNSKDTEEDTNESSQEVGKIVGKPDATEHKDSAPEIFKSIPEGQGFYAAFN